MNTVVQLRPKPATAMHCTSCGAIADAACDCGAPYMPAGEVAAKAIAENADLSNRALAKKLGVSDQTVRRARLADATNVAPEARTGADGKQHPTKGFSAGARMKVPPDGMTATEWCRQAMIWEKSGLNADEAAEKVGISRQSYRPIRDLVLLEDRTDLNAADRATVAAAIEHLNTERRVTAAHDMVKSIVEKIWPGKMNRNSGADAKRVETFKSAVISIETLSLQCINLEVPYLSNDDVTIAVEQLEDSRRNINTLIKRLKGVLSS